MSIDIMNRVWKNSKAGGSSLLLLLAIADNANDGGLCWPGQKLLSKKIRMSMKSVPRLASKLQDDGELFIISRSDQGKGNQYIVLTAMKWTQFAETLKTQLLYSDAKILKIRAWFDKKRGEDKLGGGQVGDPPTVGRGGPIVVGRGVPKAMGTEPSLTVNEPSIIPLDFFSSGLSLKTQTDEPKSVLVDTKAPYTVGEQTQTALPVPDTLAEYAADLARSAVETLDAEIMGDELTDVFGPNGRQAEIDAYQAKDRQPLTPDELLLGAMVGSISMPMRDKLSQMRSQGWLVMDTKIELLLAQFFVITQFVLPTNKSRRKFFEAGVREHIQEELFSGRIEELYKTVWDKISPDVKAGDLEITSPKSLTSFMYGILNREEGPVSELTRAQLIDRLTNDNLVEVKEINGAVGFVWVETGKLVGEIPTDILARYSRN